MDEAQQDVLSADVVVAKRPGLFLGQHDNPPRPVGKSLEQLTAPSRRRYVDNKLSGYPE
jgi:hypothetical protein